MKTLFSLASLICLSIGTPVFAQYQQITTRADFLALVDGKTLTRPLVRLKVTRDGQISGKGATWAVSGKWQWIDGYLCRSLIWGGDDLGYNCQEIAVKGTKMRITSDKGAGPSAEFRLR